MVFDGMFKNGKVLVFGVFFLAIVLAAPALRGTEEPGQHELPSPLRFRTAPFLTTNNPLFGLAAGDLNGDGKSDLAYLPENGQLVVRLNTGERTFGPEVTYQTGLFQPRSVIAADINGDGIPDLIVGGGSGFQGCVSVFLGVGDGTFQSPILSPATNSNFELQGFPLIGPIAAGDFSEAGHVDLLVADAANGTLNVLLGDGAGHFQLTSTMMTYDRPYRILLADLNGDGHLDSVVGNEFGASIAVYLGEGGGKFAPPVTYSGPNTPLAGDFGVNGITGEAIADVNCDGIPDIVVSDFNQHIDFLLGKGDGTFAYAPPSTGASFGEAGGSVFAVADFNGDGIPDVAATSINGIVIFLGKRNLAFHAPVTYPAEGLNPFVAIGDFDGDGHVDFAINSLLFSSRILLLFGEKRGGFQSPPMMLVPR